MTETEFEQWLPGFYARFRAVEAYHGKLEKPKRDATIQAWREILEPVELSLAVQATKRIASGDESWPASWDQFPSAVKAAAERIASARYTAPAPSGLSKEPRMKCLICADTGWASVFSRRAMDIAKKFRTLDISQMDPAELKDFNFDLADKSTCSNPVVMVVCNCEMGRNAMAAKQAYSKKNQKYKPPPMFNGDKMFPTYRKHDQPETVEEFVAWCLDTRAVAWEPDVDYDDVTQQSF